MDDHSIRQVLPASAAVKGPRFSTSKHWEISQTAREVLDSFDLPLRPMLSPPVERAFDAAESIVMTGAEIINTMRTGSHSVKQRRTADLATLPELAIVEPFETVAPTLQADAATALAAINDRKPHARRGVRLPRKPATAPWTASPGALVVAFVIAAVVIAVLLVTVYAPFKN
jgi:hypothetical protein